MKVAWEPLRLIVVVRRRVKVELTETAAVRDSAQEIVAGLAVAAVFLPMVTEAPATMVVPQELVEAVVLDFPT
jgi:hypothetical protein